MARKKVKRGKTVKGRKVAKRAPKQAVLKLPSSFSKQISDAVAGGVDRAAETVLAAVKARMAQEPAKAADTFQPFPSVPKAAPRLANLGADQRYTKNIGNYESFVFGFSLNIPVEIAPDANIESPETRAQLRPKYEATMGFLNEMLKEVGNEIDAARGAVQQ